MKLLGPTIKRGKSRTDYPTPWEFVRAVEKRFGPLTLDLAASETNTKADSYFDVTQNSLVQPWHRYSGNLWLNPPFDNITPWAEKCASESFLGATIFFLTPASVGANWFRDFVHGKALVLGLNGRITFEGATDPYPKDCILSCYGLSAGFDVWAWQET